MLIQAGKNPGWRCSCALHPGGELTVGDAHRESIPRARLASAMNDLPTGRGDDGIAALQHTLRGEGGQALLQACDVGLLQLEIILQRRAGATGELIQSLAPTLKA